MEVERQILVETAARIAEKEARRDPPLFAVLTGSVASGGVSSRSDIDIIFVSPAVGVVSYRYYMPELTGVGTRTEVGRIPMAYLEEVLKSGYADEISTGLREQLRNARFLLGDSDAASRIISRFATLRPKMRLLGEYLKSALDSLRTCGSSGGKESPAGCMLACDLLAKNLWRLVLVSEHKVSVQKDKHEMRAAREALDAASLTSYLRARRVSGADKTSALSTLSASQAFISKAFESAGVDARIVGEVREE